MLGSEQGMLWLRTGSKSWARYRTCGYHKMQGFIIHLKDYYKPFKKQYYT